ncbi:cAMP-specific 3' [Schistosoma japonicum]|nr:cAMP-specific 3' [Schistosoma japonicum]
MITLNRCVIISPAISILNYTFMNTDSFEILRRNTYTLNDDSNESSRDIHSILNEAIKGISPNDAVSSSQESQISPPIPPVVKPRRGSIFVTALAAEQYGSSSPSIDNTKLEEIISSDYYDLYSKVHQTTEEDSQNGCFPIKYTGEVSKN